ncbi:HPP family protein [Fodinicurvata sp. EGI_FJ10296]|uniref:HPP family protein n=1 Tax=Fodinicurvata sp. EGI_FJ10296 TaxID=3231908 RepID=UPI003451A224
MGQPKGFEPARAAVGAGLALVLCGLILIGADTVFRDGLDLWLIAPLGASAFLIFAVPNSPLAQPWSVIVGNGASAGVAVTIILLDIPIEIAAGLAVAGAMVLMALCRALHPPGAAVALSAILAAPEVADLGYKFVLTPVLVDSAILVGLGIGYNRLTGRKYPFRQPNPRNSHATADRAPDRRLGLGPEELSSILSHHNLSPNIGAEDFGRVLAAAEKEAARRHFDGLTCSDVMSRDVVSVGRDAPLVQVADLFRRHRFKTLPVLGEQDRLCGIITQNDFIQRGWPNGHRHKEPRAEDIMTVRPISVAPADGIGVLVTLLADDGVQAAPVVEVGIGGEAGGDRLVGIVTRSDLLAVLARRTILAGKTAAA